MPYPTLPPPPPPPPLRYTSYKNVVHVFCVGMLRLLRTPLQRIVAGCLAVVLSFVVSGILGGLSTTHKKMPHIDN